MPLRAHSRPISTVILPFGWRTSSSPTRRSSTQTGARSWFSRTGRECPSRALLLWPRARDVEIGFLKLVFLDDARRVGERAQASLVGLALSRIVKRVAPFRAVGGIKTKLHVLSMRRGREGDGKQEAAKDCEGEARRRHVAFC